MDNNIESILIIKLKNNIIGIYNNINLALDFIYTLVNTKIINLTDNIIIERIKINTCIILEELKVDLRYIIKQKKNINYITIDNLVYEVDSVNSTSNNLSIEESSEVNTDDTEEKEKIKEIQKKFISEQNKLGQEKILITHQLNLLKEKQKKNDEEENIFKNDLELFYKFKKFKESDSKFIIPFMFNEKYIIFENLDLNNKLSFENFKNNYKPNQVKTTYDNLFETNTEVYSNSDDDEVLFDDINIDELILFIGEMININKNYKNVNVCHI